MKRPTLFRRSLSSNVAVVVGVVLVWRGIWILLDLLDTWLFGGHSVFTALAGIVAGLFILYLPDGDLKELGKL